MRTILAYPPAAAGASPSSLLPACRAFRVTGLLAPLLAVVTGRGGERLSELLLEPDGAWIDLGELGTGPWWLEALPGETPPSSASVTIVERAGASLGGWGIPGPPPAEALQFSEHYRIWLPPPNRPEYPGYYWVGAEWGRYEIEFRVPRGARRATLYATTRNAYGGFPNVVTEYLAADRRIVRQVNASTTSAESNILRPWLQFGDGPALPGAISAAIENWLPATIRVAIDGTSAAGIVLNKWPGEPDYRFVMIWGR